MQLSELRQPLYGALRLALFDAGGLTRMDDSRRGVWVSFLAPMLMLPLMMFLQSLQGEAGTSATSGLGILRDALGYLVAVFGFPLAMFYLTQYLHRHARFNLLVVAVNWTAPWQSAIMAIAYGLFAWGAVPQTVGNLLLLAASSFNMLYIWFTVRAALNVSRGMGILIVALMAMIQLVGWLFTQITNL